MAENMGKWASGNRKIAKSGHRVAAEMVPFPQRWHGGMISANKEAVWGMSVYTTVAVVLAGLSTLPMGWQPIAAGDLGLFALTGILIGSAHFLMIEAFRFAEAAVVSPFKYFNLIVAVILGFVVWQQLPDSWTLGGAVFVIASGLYILRRETSR